MTAEEEGCTCNYVGAKCTHCRAATVSDSPGLTLLDADSGSNLEDKLYTYTDMVAAFAAGKRNERTCEDPTKDHWDFMTWAKKRFGI